MFAPFRPSDGSLSRWHAHRGNLYRAFVLSAGLHFAAALGVNPNLILDLFRPHVSIGYPGHARRGELAPEGEPLNPHVSLVRTHRFQGSVHLVSLAPAGTEPSPPRTSDQARAQAKWVSVSAAGSGGHPGRPRPGVPGDAVMVELDENWVPVSGSGQAAHSDKFQTLRIVRPEYPPAAIRAGVEGLVRLEVRVDTLGNVVGVRTRENTASSATLEDAAVRAMFRWQFKPYHVGARPVAFTVLVPFRYRLID